MIGPDRGQTLGAIEREPPAFTQAARMLAQAFSQADRMMAEWKADVERWKAVGSTLAGA